MPLDDSKFRHAVVGALKCLQCEICEEESLELLPGLCVSHAFCQACSTTYSACPSCKSDFKPNESITFSVDPQMLTALHSLESLLKVGTVEVETPVKKPVSRKSGGKPSLPESTLISSAKFDLVDAPIQTPALKKTTDKPLLLSPTPVPSPAKSESTVVSVTSTPARMRGRKSSLCSPVPDINKRNTKGETLVHVACIKKNFEEVERLLSLGANCCVRDYNGWTPLHEAAQSNRMDIAKILLEHGARVNAAGGEEYLTPLHDAVSTGYTEMVKLLVRFGADPDQRSIKGEIAKELTKNAEIIEALQNISSPEKDSSTLTSEITFADGRPLLIMSSGLDKNHKSALLSFLKIYPGKIVNKPSGDVKVVVVNNENNICNTSIAVLTGIAAGSWVVRPEWLSTCVETRSLVDPVPYELYGTKNSTTPNVFRRARINSNDMLPGLFAGCHFFFSNIEKFGSDLNKDVIMQIVKVMGGRVLSRSPDPENISGDGDVPFHANASGPLAKCSHYIIFEKGKTKKNFIEFNMQHIKALQYSWLIKCIENFELIDP